MKSKNSYAIFSFLRSEPQQAGRIITQHSGTSTDVGPVLHAIDSHGIPGILIPVPEEEPWELEWDIPAISIDYKAVRLNERYRRFLVIRCLQENLEGQFCYLIDDVLESINVSPGRAVESTIRTIARWKALLREKVGGYLSTEGIIGLLGELLFLEELSEVIGIQKSLDCWEGPSGARHDFEFATKSFEVKATQSRGQFTVTFHGSKQLEPKGTSALYVKGYQFEKATDGVTVPDVVDRLLGSGVQRFEFVQKLSNAGYEEKHSSYYRGFKFAPMTQKLCLVDDDFPKLTSSTVDPNIINKISMLNYSIDLNNYPDTPNLVKIMSEDTE